MLKQKLGVRYVAGKRITGPMTALPPVERTTECDVCGEELTYRSGLDVPPFLCGPCEHNFWSEVREEAEEWLDSS